MQRETQRLMDFQIIFKRVISLNAAWQMRGSRVKVHLASGGCFLLFQEEIVPTLLLFRVLEQMQEEVQSLFLYFPVYNTDNIFVP